MTAAQMLSDSIYRVDRDLEDKPNCMADFNNIPGAEKLLGKTQIGNIGGALEYDTENGHVVVDPNTPNIAQENTVNYHLFRTQQIVLNSTVNWADPTQTAATLDGNPYVANLLASYGAGVLGGQTITADQFIDTILLHELAHTTFNNGIGEPDKNAVTQKLFKDCVK